MFCVESSSMPFASLTLRFESEKKSLQRKIQLAGLVTFE